MIDVDENIGYPAGLYLTDEQLEINKLHKNTTIYCLHVDQEICIEKPQCIHYIGIGCLSWNCCRKDEKNTIVKGIVEVVKTRYMNGSFKDEYVNKVLCIFCGGTFNRYEAKRVDGNYTSWYVCNECEKEKRLKNAKMVQKM